MQPASPASQKGSNMPRKPNYRFDRQERERKKAAKKAEQIETKREKAALRRADRDSAVGIAEDPSSGSNGGLSSSE